MYQYSHKDVKLKVELDLSKVLVIVATIMIFLVIPIQVITYQQNKKFTSSDTEVAANQNNGVVQATTEETAVDSRITGGTLTSPQVLGASTDASFDGTTGSTRSTPFTYLGIFFIALSFVVIMFLAFDSKKYKENYSN